MGTSFPSLGGRLTSKQGKNQPLMTTNGHAFPSMVYPYHRWVPIDGTGFPSLGKVVLPCVNFAPRLEQRWVELPIAVWHGSGNLFG
ncbi:unnamed protein product [Cuscuta campestris]|uniref:Uncharacterized protein n=1 Tax=Cuscuta campestris TaxID=132261 RepID=A0A484MIE1_9ASTE|nr:unnamed protein product [Cuscuta campestris]VFQ88713.1 unnamed protein product [Cuscuta campestris]